MRSGILGLLLLVSTAAFADEPLCGNGPELDAMLQRMRERSAQRMRIAPEAAAPVTVLRNGTFFIEADAANVTPYRRNDLGGRSVVFEPRGASKFSVHTTALAYTEPPADPVKVFADAPEWFVRYDLRSFTVPLFGRSVSTIWISAYNAVYLSEPVAQSEVMQVDALDAAVQREAVLSPLLMSKSKPKNLVLPDVFVQETGDAVVVTWRTTKGKYFGYDVQAAVRRDGTIVYSYRTLRNIEWGTPLLSAGRASLEASQRVLAGGDDFAGDVANRGDGLAPMLDISRFEIVRIGESDLLLFRLRLAKALDTSLIAEGAPLRYWVNTGTQIAQVTVERGGSTLVYTPGRSRSERNGPASVRGDTIEIFVAQDSLLLPAGPAVFRAYSSTSTSSVSDSVQLSATIDAAPRKIVADLSAAGGAELALPIAEPFVLGALSVDEVWRAIRQNYGIRDDEIDGLAIYQSFYTDLIFYAGAYSTVGNPQVDGIGSRGSYGASYAKSPALLHMNQFTYGYNSAEKSTSQVILHEFGHRWLYHTAIRVNGTNSRVLNPVSAHPAQFVHLPSAFKLYEDEESSTMGGATFTQQGDGTWMARALNAGYSWPELYLMGLAAPEEVVPWFYLDKTDPKLGGEYWPPDKQVVTGERKDVTIDQILAASGPRKPSSSASQRGFRVPFVLVTYPGETATSGQVAQMEAIRALFEKNFATATGGRASVTTQWPLSRRRAAR